MAKAEVTGTLSDLIETTAKGERWSSPIIDIKRWKYNPIPPEMPPPRLCPPEKVVIQRLSAPREYKQSKFEILIIWLIDTFFDFPEEWYKAEIHPIKARQPKTAPKPNPPRQ